MTNPTVRYGGQLEIGDFIAIADQGGITLGWYVGRGDGTIQYYYYEQPGDSYDRYNEFLNNPSPNSWYAKTYAKHKKFSSKLIWKGYIYGDGVRPNSKRVIKIDNPESLFTNAEDLEAYNNSKQALLTLNFPLK
jgi:hypothetical protein